MKFAPTCVPHMKCPKSEKNLSVWPHVNIHPELAVQCLEMYNTDRFERSGKLSYWNSGAFSEKGRNGVFPSMYGDIGLFSHTFPYWPYIPSPLLSSSANVDRSAISTASSMSIRGPFMSDDDTNLSLLSAAFFFPKGFVGDLLSQYLFKSGT